MAGTIRLDHGPDDGGHKLHALYLGTQGPSGIYPFRATEAAVRSAGPAAAIVLDGGEVASRAAFHVRADNPGAQGLGYLGALGSRRHATKPRRFERGDRSFEIGVDIADAGGKGGHVGGVRRIPKMGQSRQSSGSEIFNQFVRNIARGLTDRCVMRTDRDIVPERYLAVTAAGMLLLCGSLLAIAFG